MSNINELQGNCPFMPPSTSADKSSIYYGSPEYYKLYKNSTILSKKKKQLLKEKEVLVAEKNKEIKAIGKQIRKMNEVMSESKEKYPVDKANKKAKRELMRDA